MILSLSLSLFLSLCVVQVVTLKHQPIHIGTRHKYLGGALMKDGTILGVPSHANKILKIVPSGICSGNKNSHTKNLQFQIDKQVGTENSDDKALQIMQGKFKWLRAQVLEDNSVYFIPAWSPFVMKVSGDHTTATVKVIQHTHQHQHQHQESNKIQCVSSSRWQWHVSAKYQYINNSQYKLFIFQ